jgi:hypothetical protein
MKKRFVFMAVALTLPLSGCGKPPKDVAQKIALNYINDMGSGTYVELSDIKYLSAASKDGGYLVNIQAGDALCEMRMIKGEKEWMAKGISCNGDFLSREKTVERKKVVFTKLIQKEVDKTKAKEITNKNGTTTKYIFDGKRYALVLNTQAPATDVPNEKKKEVADNFTQLLCSAQEFKTAREVGYDTGVDMVSKDNKTLLSVTVSSKDDCQNQNNSLAAPPPPAE